MVCRRMALITYRNKVRYTVCSALASVYYMMRMKNRTIFNGPMGLKLSTEGVIVRDYFFSAYSFQAAALYWSLRDLYIILRFFCNSLCLYLYFSHISCISWSSTLLLPRAQAGSVYLQYVGFFRICFFAKTKAPHLVM